MRSMRSYKWEMVMGMGMEKPTKYKFKLIKEKRDKFKAR